MAVYEWDEHNTEHIARHDVYRYEFEEAASDPRRVRFSAHSGNTGFIGKTDDGRVLVVIMKRLEPGSWRPATAREANAKEKQSYRRQNK